MIRPFGYLKLNVKCCFFFFGNLFYCDVIVVRICCLNVMRWISMQFFNVYATSHLISS